MHKISIYERYFKRWFDIAISFFALLILSPLFLFIAVLVRLKLGAPVIFSQRRPGLNGKPFIIYKFRTMTNKKDESGNLLPDKDRLTKFGKLLRSTSLDELPELWNILKGDMSIIGPRPLLMEYLPLYNATQKRRHEVRPGLTGYAQVSGRNALSWDEKFHFDVEYVDQVSFMLDIKIFFMTIYAVLMKKGISSSSSVTMEEFLGNQNIEE